MFNREKYLFDNADKINKLYALRDSEAFKALDELFDDLEKKSTEMVITNRKSPDDLQMAISDLNSIKRFKAIFMGIDKLHEDLTRLLEEAGGQNKPREEFKV